MFLLLLTLALFAIVLFDAPRLVKEKMWKELAVFFLIWSIGAVMSVAAVQGIDLPNPTDLLEKIFGPFVSQ